MRNVRLKKVTASILAMRRIMPVMRISSRHLSVTREEPGMCVLSRVRCGYFCLFPSLFCSDALAIASARVGPQLAA